MQSINLSGIFTELFGIRPAVIARAPGRVNLLGEHTDYNEGWVLPAAIEQAAWVAAAPADDQTVSIHALDLDESVHFALSQLDERIDLQGHPLPAWARYPAGIAWALRQNGLQIGGLRALLSSQVPIGAGLSSSAAVEIAFALAWQGLADWKLERLELARIAQQAENAYVGVSSGLMDQFASAEGAAGHVLFLDCRHLVFEALPLPEQINLVITDSTLRRSLSTSQYNTRREECQLALQLLAERLPGISALRDVSIEDFQRFAAQLPAAAGRRAEHVIHECQRVRQAAQALRDGDPQRLGELMLAGHASLRDLFEVSLPELDLLVELASAQDGCLGSRLTGAGFGGCTVSLVEQEKTGSFVRSLKDAYRRQTNLEAEIWVSRPGRGAQLFLPD